MKWLLIFLTSLAFATDKYFVTIADTEHYNWVIEQIHNIKQYNTEVKEIAVYDLYLTKLQREQLQSMENVVVRDLEEKNPQMRDQFVVRPSGRISRGWYTWKGIAVKDALKHYPYFIYMDAMVRPIQNLEPVFRHIVQNRSFFITAGHDLAIATTTIMQKHFAFTDLDKPSIQSNIMGITRDLEKQIAEPAYQAAEDINLFIDDGTSKGGFGTARYDQSIFSILVHKAKLPILNREGDCLRIDGETVPFLITSYFKLRPT